jgi:hypothetical protein
MIKNKPRIFHNVFLAVLVLAVLSCNLPFATATPTPTIEPSPTIEPTPTVEPSQPTDPNEVIIPATTKVMDSELLSSLESVDADGTLHFARSTPELAALQPGDVLVSDASETAPFGLLKKIISIRTEGGSVIITTEDALITDAVHQGSGSITRELKPEDIRSSRILQPGVTFEGLKTTASEHYKSGLMSPALGENLSPAGLKYTFNTDLGTGGQVQVTGSATINPIMDFGLNISCDETVNLLVGRVCKEIPDLNVLAKVGIKENANLVIKGRSSYTFNQNYQIARHEFSPITFPLGPVPVVLVPVLKIYLQGDGSLTAQFDYVVDQNLTLAAGFRYNSDKGFEDLSEYVSSFTQTGPTFTGSLEVRAMVGVHFEIMLYGLIGPYGSLEGGAHLKANLAGLPSAKNLVWTADGCLWLNVGIDSVKVLDIHYKKELWKTCVEFGQGKNNPPSVSIRSPESGRTFPEGTITLLGSALDFDGGTLSCTWTSSMSGDTFKDVNNCDQAKIKLTGAGLRTITLTATDASGLSGNASITTTVVVTPPTAATPLSVNISSPPDESTIGPANPVTLTGSVSGGSDPYTYIWSVIYPTDLYGSGGSTYSIGNGNNYTWTPNSTLPFERCSVDNFARIVLTVRDGNGAEGSASILIRIFRLC